MSISGPMCAKDEGDTPDGNRNGASLIVVPFYLLDLFSKRDEMTA